MAQFRNNLCVGNMEIQKVVKEKVRAGVSHNSELLRVESELLKLQHEMAAESAGTKGGGR